MIAAGSDDRLEQVYDHYARSARKRRSWAANNAGNIAIRAELAKRVQREVGQPLLGREILDVGCGTGWLMTELARAGVPRERLHGIDLLKSRVEAAQRALPGADIRPADARRLPYDSGAFDVVLLLTILSSASDRDAIAEVLTEARRVLAPDGVLLAYEPRVPNPFNRSTRLVTRRDLQRGLGPGWRSEPLTVLPPLSRRLGQRTECLYPRLAAIDPLLTHRLIVLRR